MAAMMETTFQATRTITATADLLDRAAAIRTALERGDAVGHKEGLARLQGYLLGLRASQLFRDEDEILDALIALGGPRNIRGQRVASYLMVHANDTDTRAFWNGAEGVLMLAA